LIVKYSIYPGAGYSGICAASAAALHEEAVVGRGNEVGVRADGGSGAASDETERRERRTDREIYSIEAF
jgi:hypothetical protein